MPGRATVSPAQSQSSGAFIWNDMIPNLIGFISKQPNSYHDSLDLNAMIYSLLNQLTGLHLSEE